MSTTTTNFNFPIPQSTDLVKDGATAIAALGTSVDTQFVDLKGGTTGQVLAKASNTDLDYSWVTTDDANAIQNAIVDAKGDLIAATANDTPARLAVGANGETLVADSSTSTGLRYQVPVNVNPVLNSAFQVGQRGTSFAITNGQQYTLDRWYAATSNAGTFSRQATGDTTNLPFIQYCMRVQRNSGATGVSDLIINQPMETVNSIPFAGKTVTMSFYARKGANFSATSSNIFLYLISGTGTDQNFAAGYTGQALPINNPSATLTTTWQRFTYTGTVASTATELTPYFYYTPTGTAGADDYYEITGVQIEVGSVATPFKTNGATLQKELAACQRYYWRSSGGAYAGIGSGMATTTTTAKVSIPLPVAMRVVPTAIDYSNVGITDQITATQAATLSIIAAGGSLVNPIINADFASAFAAAKPVDLTNNNNSNGYVGLSAEL